MLFLRIGNVLFLQNKSKAGRRRRKSALHGVAGPLMALSGKGSMMKKEADGISLDSRMIEIGQRIKALRMEKGYTSAEIFAYEHDLNRVSYWRMEKGCNMTLNSLLRILDIHQISLQEFFKDFDD